MSYTSIVAMAGSQSLISRIIAAAAESGRTSTPQVWAQENIWVLAATAGWGAAWDQALQKSDQKKFNPDLGQRDDVITDVMIKDAVTSLLNKQNPPETPTV